MIGGSWCFFFFFFFNFFICFQWWWLAENEEINQRDGLAALLSSMKVVLVEFGLTMKLRSAMELGSAVR